MAPDDLFGASKNYWLDLNQYDPVASAQNINKPMLFLQGEKDYQVTMQDFNMYKQALKDNSNAAFISYPGLNHLFSQSEGEKAVPADYNKPLRLDQNVINDIAKFVK